MSKATDNPTTEMETQRYEKSSATEWQLVHRIVENTRIKKTSLLRNRVLARQVLGYLESTYPIEFMLAVYPDMSNEDRLKLMMNIASSEQEVGNSF